MIHKDILLWMIIKAKTTELLKVLKKIKNLLIKIIINLIKQSYWWLKIPAGDISIKINLWAIWIRFLQKKTLI